MSALRDAAHQALEALRWTQSAWQQGSQVGGKVDAAITALRAALAEEEQEPVAWRYLYSDGFWRFSNGERVNGGAPVEAQALYTAPPAARVPLTDEQIKYATLEQQNHLLDHIYEYGVSAEGVTQRIYKLARAIERAHGITNQSTQGE